MVVPTKLGKESLIYRQVILKQKTEQDFPAKKKKLNNEKQISPISDSLKNEESEIEEGEVLVKKKIFKENIPKPNGIFLCDSSESENDSPNQKKIKTRSSTGNKFTIKHTNHRSTICKFFLTNSCKKGDDCNFSHNIRKFPCKAYHIRNNCTRKVCTFSHDPISIAEYNKIKEEEMKENNNSYISPFD